MNRYSLTSPASGHDLQNTQEQVQEVQIQFERTENCEVFPDLLSRDRAVVELLDALHVIDRQAQEQQYSKVVDDKVFTQCGDEEAQDCAGDQCNQTAHEDAGESGHVRLCRVTDDDTPKVVESAG